MHRYFSLTSLVAAAIAVPAIVHAAPSPSTQNWPQWRGPLQNGVASEGNPPIEWSETKNVKWKAPLPGDGTGTPIIWENRVFVLTAISTGRKGSAAAPAPANAERPAGAPQAAPEQSGRDRGGADGFRGGPGGPGGPGGRRGGPGGRGGFGGGPPPTDIHEFVVLCLDRQTGKVLWRHTAREEVPHEGHHADGSFAPSSPVTDGQHVFAYFGSRGLYCYDMNGVPKWSQDFGDMRTSNGFGEGSSPALHGNTIVVNWDNEGDSFIIALDKNTGATRWKKARQERTTWATPLIVEHDGKAQVITSATGKIRSYDLATGDMVWECGGMTANVIPTPVAGHGMVYCTSGFRGNALLAIRLGRTGDLTDSDAIVWRHNRATPYVPSPLLYGDRLYFLASNNGRLSCFNALDGTMLMNAETIDGIPNVYASPVGASDRIYLAGRNGASVVIKRSDKIEVLATNRLDDKFDASPAIAGNELFLRGRANLYCLATPQ